MDLYFDYYSISLLIGGFTAFLSGIVVFIHNRKKLENIAWLLSNLTSAIWSFGYFVMITATSKDVAIWSNWILHVASIYIPVCYFLSVVSITDTYKKHKNKILIASVIGCIFLILTPTEFFVRDVIPKASFNFVPDAGPLYIFYAIYFFSLVIYSLYVVLEKIKESTDKIQIERYKYMILFTIFGFAGGGSVFLLTFNINIPPYPIILFSLYPAVSGYAIFRYQLFNVKVITTEILVFVIWISLLIRILLSNSLFDRLVNIGLLIFMNIAGVLLIRSVMKEIALRERVEGLANDLEKTNNELSTINSKLGVANNKLKELDQLKSEFLSLATHQIRAPLTAIKGYASLILEGDYGKVTPQVESAVKNIFESCQNLVLIVGDFLDISRIEQGRMKYEMADFDIVVITKDIIEKLRPNIESSGLTVSFESIVDKQIVCLDQNKIRQVVGNIIDNSIKYTKEGGIKVSISIEDAFVKISVKDTGIGISQDDIPKLFAKFVRAKDASKTNVIGTGLGLYIAKQMVEAQGGRVYVQSEGLGKGSDFIIMLPIKK